MRLRQRRLFGLLACAALLGLGGRGPDPGIVLRLERSQSTLASRDGRDGEPGPELRVVVGSPAHPTPLGRFALRNVILNPAWRPGPLARAAGARPLPPSVDGPMGVGKIPFAGRGSIAIHGGALPLLVGKPVSSGCVRLTDADLERLLDWLEQRSALASGRPTREGEVHRPFLRPVHLHVL